MNQKRLPGKVKWGYGIGLLGESAPLNLFYVYFIFFLTTAVGMEASIAGTISMIGAFWNAATDIYAGYRSDNSLNPKGRRRPFIYRWALPYAIFTVLLFANFDINGMAQTIYYMIICLVFLLPCPWWIYLI